MGDEVKEFKLFMDGEEFKGLGCGEITFEDSQLIMPITVGTKYGDINFRGIFTEEEYQKVIDIHERIKHEALIQKYMHKQG